MSLATQGHFALFLKVFVLIETTTIWNIKIKAKSSLNDFNKSVSCLFQAQTPWDTKHREGKERFSFMSLLFFFSTCIYVSVWLHMLKQLSSPEFVSAFDDCFFLFEYFTTVSHFVFLFSVNTHRTVNHEDANTLTPHSAEVQFVVTFRRADRLLLDFYWLVNE